MKKTFLSGLLLFVAAVTLSGCSKDETTDLATTAQTTISATVEEPTRTSLDGAFVKWMAGDKIMVANASNATAEYTLKTGAGTTSGTFTGNDLGAGAKFALYPYSATATCASGKFSFEMPAKQDNDNVTFGDGANPMIAQSDAKGVLNFKNVCGAIRLQLKGTQQVSKIVVSTATTAAKLSGKATVTLNADGLPVLKLDEAAATNTVTLNCNNAQLKLDAATSFYVVVPAATYATGLQFMIYDETGTHIYSLPTTQALTITRSKVAKMPEKTVAKMNFPDPKFRAILNKTYNLKLTADGDIDVNNGDNKTIFTSQLKIDASDKQIASLKGIEYFTALTYIDCGWNQLTSLDVSKNTKLTNLYCDINQLTSLDVSKNTALTSFRCGDNQLTSLDVSKNTALTSFGCYFNKLTSLDVSKNTALTQLGCENNQLTNLDVSKNTALMGLSCDRNELPSLDVSKNTALTFFSCDYNELTSLDVSKNTALISLFCYENQLTSLDISTCSMLDRLVCGNQHADGGTGETYTKLKLICSESQKALTTMPNDATYNKNVIFERIIAFPDPKFRAALVATYNLKLTSDQTDIDVNNEENKKLFANTTMLKVQEKDIKTLQGIEYFTALTDLNCCFNQLTSLDLSKNTVLTSFVGHANQLTSLDVSKNTVLSILWCYKNQLTNLDLSKNTALKKIRCHENQLTNLDVSKNTALTEFVCSYNKLTSLDVSQNTALTFIGCQSNQLTSLDVSKNTALTDLYCDTNQLPSLDVSQNTALTRFDCGYNQLPSLDVSKNTALTIFRCGDNQLPSLDVSKNTALTELYCVHNQLPSLDIQSLTSLGSLYCGQQSAGGVVYPNYSELKLFMTQAQFNANLGVGDFNENVKRVPPDGK